MTAAGWKQLLDGWPWFQGAGCYPLYPHSEFMPPVFVGRKPYDSWDPVPLDDHDPWGWPITEYEEVLTLRPGLRAIARQLLDKLRLLCRGTAEGEIAEYKLRENPFWPDELADRAHTLRHERFVLLLPLTLSLTQDDKARVRWTLFGGSEQGPARPFWKSFFTAPGVELPAEQALDWLRSVLASAYREQSDDLHAAGLRVLPQGDTFMAFGDEGPLPSWTAPFLWNESQTLRGVRHLLTFRPFGALPPSVRRKYLAGELHLLPFPGSLLFWGVPSYLRLREQLPFAAQVPLLHFLERHGGLDSIRIPQAGWFEQEGPGHANGHGHGPFRDTYKATHRTGRVHRHQNDLVGAQERKLVHVLFSTRPEDIGLDHKPMARNVQLWDSTFQVLLDGPHADAEEIAHAAEMVARGGTFGYRMITPAHRVGRHEVYWHRPLVAYLDPATRRPQIVPDVLPGYFTAYQEGATDLRDPVELWPRLLEREPHVLNVKLFHGRREDPPHCTLTNVRKLLDAAESWPGQQLPRPFARHLLMLDKRRTLEGWLRSLARHLRRPADARKLVALLEERLEPAKDAALPEVLTFEHTASRDFEKDYWNTITLLSAGDYRNKNNADCVLDATTQARLTHHRRDLDPLGDYLLDYYARLIAELGMTKQVQLAELPFVWRTQYPFSWMGGWVRNQEGTAYERNLVVIIPGRDRRRAVIMADHYDTAYQGDEYDRQNGGSGARLAAPGADDNGSATAALMLGARAFLDLSRQGRLACDIWLIHLTGEEFPAEGQGACRLCEQLVEGSLRLRTLDGRWRDCSGVRIQGIYVLDMIGHNSNQDRDVFQISPGVSAESLGLAYHAHVANQLWNARAEACNREPARRRAGRGRRSADGSLPPLARYATLHGEIRPPFDLRSTLYNSDGQVLSDAGVPVVLLMENYEIDRRGYHDSHDNLTQLNLDYGAALAAVAIETVAQAAAE